jgi:lipoyl(octanoyl) transferase
MNELEKDHEDAIAVDLGRREYGSVYELQKRIRREVIAGGREVVIFVEHEPVITCGKRAKERNLIVSRERLAQLGVEVARVERGGDVTYHGPGQIVCYPIFRIGARVRAHVRALAEAARSTCLDYGVSATWDEKRPGLWTGGKKIAAIGIHVHRGVAIHGLALNVKGPLSGFDLIVPCGLADAGMTSIEQVSGGAPEVGEVARVLAGHLATATGRKPFTFFPDYEIFSSPHPTTRAP